MRVKANEQAGSLSAKKTSADLAGACSLICFFFFYLQPGAFLGMVAGLLKNTF